MKLESGCKVKVYVHEVRDIFCCDSTKSALIHSQVLFEIQEKMLLEYDNTV